MRRVILLTGLAIVFAGCSSQSNSGYTGGSAPASQSGSGTLREVPAANGRSTPAQAEQVQIAPSTNNTPVTPPETSAQESKGRFENQNLNGAPAPANDRTGTNGSGQASASNPAP